MFALVFRPPLLPDMASWFEVDPGSKADVGVESPRKEGVRSCFYTL